MLVKVFTKEGSSLRYFDTQQKKWMKKEHTRKLVWKGNLSYFPSVHDEIVLSKNGDKKIVRGLIFNLYNKTVEIEIDDHWSEFCIYDEKKKIYKSKPKEKLELNNIKKKRDSGKSLLIRQS